jgi:hypothetical protein
MRQFTDSRRTARGFNELRNRYVRRAEFLCTNPAFLEDVRFFRAMWKRDFPAYDLDRPLHSLPGLFPWKPPEETARAEDLCDVCLGPGRRDAAEAESAWYGNIAFLELRNFSPKDFYAVQGLSPQAFIQECLLRDPRLLIGDTERFFDWPKLALTMDLSEYDEYGIEPEEWELYSPGAHWYIPVYPGLTADELRAAIPRIIEQVETYLGPQTVSARIEELRQEGLTQQSIADRLGLNVGTVQAYLRTVRDREKALAINPTKRTAS